jgi:hypothetical protein
MAQTRRHPSRRPLRGLLRMRSVFSHALFAGDDREGDSAKNEIRSKLALNSLVPRAANGPAFGR